MNMTNMIIMAVLVAYTGAAETTTLKCYECQDASVDGTDLTDSKACDDEKNVATCTDQVCVTYAITGTVDKKAAKVIIGTCGDAADFETDEKKKSECDGQTTAAKLITGLTALTDDKCAVSTCDKELCNSGYVTGISTVLLAVLALIVLNN